MSRAEEVKVEFEETTQPHSQSNNEVVVAYENILDDQFIAQFVVAKNIHSKEDHINRLLFRNLLRSFNYRMSFQQIHHILKLLSDNWVQSVRYIQVYHCETKSFRFCVLFYCVKISLCKHCCVQENKPEVFIKFKQHGKYRATVRNGKKFMASKHMCLKINNKRQTMGFNHIDEMNYLGSSHSQLSAKYPYTSHNQAPNKNFCCFHFSMWPVKSLP